MSLLAVGVDHTHGPSDPRTIVFIAGAVLNFQYVTLAAFVTLLYDIMITFNQEVIHIYGGRNSIVKLLWFLNRILVPVKLGAHLLVCFWENPAPSLCLSLSQNFANWVALANIFIIQCLLALRTAAIYERSLGVSVFISVLLIGSTISRIIILILNPIRNTPSKGSARGTLCLDFPNRTNAASFYAAVFLDAVLYTMTVVRLLVQSPQTFPGIQRKSTLFRLLFQDGSIYFLAVAAAMSMSVIGFFYRPFLGAFTESDLYIAACSIACSRLILHLKESSRQAIYRDLDIPSSWEAPFGLEDGIPSMRPTRSEMRFGFACDGSMLSPQASGAFEEIDIVETERGVIQMTSNFSVELSSLRSTAPSPEDPGAPHSESDGEGSS